jgi:Ca-activated chloride channel family protein
MNYRINPVFLIWLMLIPALARDETRALYDAGRYTEAIKKYDQILAQHPDWEELHYGKGSALYKSNQLDDAVREFERALAVKDPLQKSATFYNLGNALLKSNRLEESLKFYQRAIELNPQDYDAKHNFELVKQLLQQQQNKSSQQKQDKQDQKKQQQQQPQSNQSQPNQSQQPEQQQKSKEQQSQEQQSVQQRREQQKSQEEAAQILDALKDNEKKLMQERLKTKYTGIKREKDW